MILEINCKGENIMSRSDIGIFSILKILLIVVFLSSSVGIAFGINDQYEDFSSSEKKLSGNVLKNIEVDPIEITSMRTAISKTFENGDGTYTAEIYIKPIHYLDNDGNWLDLGESNLRPGGSSRNIESYPTSADTFICTDTPETGSSLNEDSNVGENEALWLPSESTQVWRRCRILMKFDYEVAKITDAEIVTAEIKLNYFRSSALEDGTLVEMGETIPLSVTINPLTRNWIEGSGITSEPGSNGATWLTRDGSDPWNLRGGDFDSSLTTTGSTPESGYGETSFDIKEILTSWIQGKPNHGVIIRGGSQTEGYDLSKNFKSKENPIVEERPKLVIKYFTNTPPKIKKINDAVVPATRILDMGKIVVEQPVEVLITAEDTDQDNITCSADGSTEIHKLDGNVWKLIFIPTENDMGETLINITAKDERGLTDQVTLRWAVLSASEAPSVVFSIDNPEVKFGDTLSIKGEVNDKGSITGTSNEVLIRIYQGEKELLPVTSAFITDGSFRYNIKIPEEIDGSSTKGTWTIEAWLSTENFESQHVTTKLTIQDKSEKTDDSDNSTLMLGIGVIIGIIIVVLILLFLFYSKKKQKEKPVKKTKDKESETKLKKSSKRELDPWDRELESIKVEPSKAPFKAKGPGKAKPEGKLPKPEPKPKSRPMAAAKVPKDKLVDKGRLYKPRVYTLDSSKKCGICLGAIKTGLTVVHCKCGKYYHLSCASRVGSCPTCDASYDTKFLAKYGERGKKVADAADEDFSDLTEFQRDIEVPVKGKAPMDILKTRLAKGEIDVKSYDEIRKKINYEDKTQDFEIDDTDWGAKQKGKK
jgi:uncharacterized membrane protein